MPENVANAPKLLLGKDLPMLVRLLKSTDSNVSSMLGLSIHRWYVMSADGTRKTRNPKKKDTGAATGDENGDQADAMHKGEEPLIPRYAIMTRFLMSHPHYVAEPSFEDLLKALQELDPSMDHRKLAIILGLELSAGDRVRLNNELVVSLSNKLSPTANKMIALIYTNLQLAKSEEEKRLLLDRLIENVNQEAAARGIPYGLIWEKGGWTKNATHPSLKTQKK